MPDMVFMKVFFVLLLPAPELDADADLDGEDSMELEPLMLPSM